MKLFKISTIALAMALIGWVACGSDNSDNKDAHVVSIPGTGGTIPADTASGSGGAGGSTSAPDSGAHDSASADVPISQDAPDASISEAGPIDAPPTVDGGGNICTGLSAADCHLAIINAPTDPAVSALDPGPNPTVPYPNCSAQ